jgi:hypothetical protein
VRTLRHWRRRGEGDQRPVGTTDQLTDDRACADEAAKADEHNPFGQEHAWWAERERLQRVFVAPRVDDEADESPLSEFWSPESLFTWGRRPGDDDAPYYEDEQPFDPHEVLGLPLYAPWDQVVAAHRRLAKEHHPDRLVDATPEDRATSEERMRLVNQAYNELRRQRSAN